MIFYKFCKLNKIIEINEIFEDESINMCTWDMEIWGCFVDSDENEMGGLPENINYTKIRLLFKY